MSQRSSVLVTGGAGYIGSHTLLQLVARGERVVVLDNLFTGFRQAVRDAQLVVGDVGDRALVDRLLREHHVDTIIHFAANTIVPESVSNPLKYYGNNTCGTRSLLEAAAQAGVKHFVFSSTAAVYGMPLLRLGLRGDTPTAPINPYGTSKLMSEWCCAICAPPTRCATSRCVISMSRAATTQGRIGQSTRGATLLVKVACQVAIGQRPYLSVYGTDYPHTRRHRGARLHPRRGPGRRGTSMPSATCANGGQSLIGQLRLWTRLLACAKWCRAWRKSPGSSWRCARNRGAPVIRRRSSPRRTGSVKVLGWSPKLDDI